MKSKSELKELLKQINGKGYKSYKDIGGEYDFGEFTLLIDHVQGDPYARPSRMRVRVNQDKAGFPEDTYKKRSREIALRDYLTRTFYKASKRFAIGNRGSGKSGVISIQKPGQEILERSSVLVTQEFVEARFSMGLPAFGRKVAGNHAEAMFFEELLAIVQFSLIFETLDQTELYKHIETAEDADFVRSELENLGILCFVGNGSILPRASGVDHRPLDADKAVRFVSPNSLNVDLNLPNYGAITGMGFPRGVNLITGGGYHGKSTLLRAIEQGIYNHIPGDGREFVVTNPNAFKIRAEDGRRVSNVNISPFISNLPFGKDTKSFSTDYASGSISQGANIIEALEVGADVLLLDEDTSATNFMIRDHRMQELVTKDKEPITPFIDKVRSLLGELRVSTILVIGGSGEYFDVADRIIRMDEYKPEDVTVQAKSIAAKFPITRDPEGGGLFGMVSDRIPLPQSIDPGKGRREVSILMHNAHSISFGTSTIDLAAVEQLTDICQTNAIGDAIVYGRKYIDGKRTLRQAAGLIMMDIAKDGLDVLNSQASGDYAEFRTLELAAAINRLRTLEVKQK